MLRKSTLRGSYLAGVLREPMLRESTSRVWSLRLLASCGSVPRGRSSVSQGSASGPPCVVREGLKVPRDHLDFRGGLSPSLAERPSVCSASSRSVGFTP